MKAEDKKWVLDQIKAAKKDFAKKLDEIEKKQTVDKRWKFHFATEKDIPPEGTRGKLVYVLLANGEFQVAYRPSERWDWSNRVSPDAQIVAWRFA